MKLLLDENLSDRIISRIIDLQPHSEHVKTLGLINTDDAVIWEYAKINGFVNVSKDSDFHQCSLLYGHPPKFIYLRIGKPACCLPSNPASLNFYFVWGLRAFRLRWQYHLHNHGSAQSPGTALRNRSTQSIC